MTRDHTIIFASQTALRAINEKPEMTEREILAVIRKATNDDEQTTNGALLVVYDALTTPSSTEE